MESSDLLDSEIDFIKKSFNLSDNQIDELKRGKIFKIPIDNRLYEIKIDNDKLKITCYVSLKAPAEYIDLKLEV